MRITRTSFIIAVSLVATMATAEPGSKRASPDASTSTITQIDWKDLSPADYHVEDVLHDYYEKVAKLEDSDPRALALADELRSKWDAAPAVKSLDRKLVKLTGFLVSLEGSTGTVSEFLLVPFLGTCVHIPPPPSNQIVLVRMATKPYTIVKDYSVVTVTGRLRTQYARNKLANAAYTLDAASVETPR
jgi:uncharacterized protein